MCENYESGRARAVDVLNFTPCHLDEIISAAEGGGVHCATPGVQFLGYMPFGGDGAPLLSNREVLATAERAARVLSQPVTPAQLLDSWLKTAGRGCDSKVGQSRSDRRQSVDIRPAPSCCGTHRELDRDEHYDCPGSHRRAVLKYESNGA